MFHAFSRTELLLGGDAMKVLKDSRVAIFGLGGVGSYAAEALARSGVGAFVLVDNDAVCVTNINRQLIATHDTIGRKKVDAMAERIAAINPAALVDKHDVFYLPGQHEGLIDHCNYIVDAIDTVSGKLALIEEANNKNIPIISCMGAGNKLDATRFEVADIFQTSVCPLCRVMRHELRKRGIERLKTVYSRETPAPHKGEAHHPSHSLCDCAGNAEEKDSPRRRIPGSVAFVPPVAGLIAAGEVVQDLTKI